MPKTYCITCKSLGYVWAIRRKPIEPAHIGKLVAITPAVGLHTALKQDVRLRIECMDCGGYGVTEK